MPSIIRTKSLVPTFRQVKQSETAMIKHFSRKGSKRELGLKKIEDYGDVRIYQKGKGRQTRFYADYRDFNTRKWVRNVPIKKSEIEAYRALREEKIRSLGRSIVQNESAIHFRTALTAKGNKVVTAVTIMNRARGLLKTYLARYPENADDPDFISQMMELIDLYKNADISGLQDYLNRFNADKTNTEIDQWYDYSDGDYFSLDGIEDYI